VEAKQDVPEHDDRRSFLKKAGTFAAVTPPAVTFLLSTSMSSRAIAASGGHGPKGNNGVGNGQDPQPPGNPPVNDGPGTGPGHPGNTGGGGNVSANGPQGHGKH
jgi:hypothetical protein